MVTKPATSATLIRWRPAYDGGVLSPYWDEAPRALARNLARTMREEAGRC